MKPTRDFLFFLIVTIFTCLTNSLSNDKVICHVYGDPHLITFNDSTNEQFSCRTPGNLTLLSNEFLRIQIQFENETSAIQQYRIEFFKDNATIPCRIDQQNQRCEGNDVIITRPNLNQISILYGREQIHLSIFEQKSSYDLSIRMPSDLVNSSMGLCIEPSEDECEPEQLPLSPSYESKEVCQHYFNTSVQLSQDLTFSNNSKRLQNAFMACLNDYETTGDYNFGVSGIHMIIQDGFHHQQLTDAAFELKTLLSIPKIDAAILKTTNTIAFHLTTTTSPTTVTQTTTTATTSTTTTSSTTTSTTTQSTTSSTTTSTTTQSTTKSTMMSTTSNGSIIENSIVFILINGILFLFNIFF